MARDLEPKYSTYYTGPDGSGVMVKHHTKEANDDYAKGLELMGVTEITKSFYNPAMREWFRYHNDKDIEEKNNQQREINPGLDE